MVGLDNYSFFTKEEAKLIAELQRAESSTKLIEVPYLNLVFMEQDKAENKYGEEIATKLGVEQVLVEDNTSRLLTVDSRTKECRMVGDSSFLSIGNQYKIYGPGFMELSAPTKAYVLNELSETKSSKSVTLVVIDKKIRAVMTAGDDGRTFTHMPVLDLFYQFKQSMADRGIDLMFDNGKFSYTFINFCFKAMNEELQDLYDKSDYSPYVDIVTSETGYSATRIIPVFKNKSGAAIRLFKEALVLEHKGGNTLTKLSALVPKLFVKFQDFIKTMDKYMDLNVRYPMETIEKVSKSIKLAKKRTEKVKNLFDISFSAASSFNFYDVFSAFIDLKGAYEDEKEYEMMLGDIFSLNIETLLKRVEKEAGDDLLI